jgi:hypothetical protein
VIRALFHREIDAGEDLVEVVRAEGSPHVSVYTGPFVWQIETRDLSPVIATLACVVAQPKVTPPSLRLAGGSSLQIGVGIEGAHVWISAANAHMRLTLVATGELLAALSEARAHITRGVETLRAEQIADGVKPTC